MDNRKAVCQECDWHGLRHKRLVATNPFDVADTIYGCPSCREIDCFLIICDKDDCWEPVTCGTSTPDVYRLTCSRHRPVEAAEAKEGKTVFLRDGSRDVLDSR